MKSRGAGERWLFGRGEDIREAMDMTSEDCLVCRDCLSRCGDRTGRGAASGGVVMGEAGSLRIRSSE